MIQPLKPYLVTVDDYDGESHEYKVAADSVQTVLTQVWRVVCAQYGHDATQTMNLKVEELAKMPTVGVIQLESPT
jgi:hypothetical protein